MRTWERDGKPVCAVNFTLERDALEILRRHAQSPRGYGRFLTRLLYEEEARRQERARMCQELQAVIGAA